MFFSWLNDGSSKQRSWRESTYFRVALYRAKWGSIQIKTLAIYYSCTFYGYFLADDQYMDLDAANLLKYALKSVH